MEESRGKKKGKKQKRNLIIGSTDVEVLRWRVEDGKWMVERSKERREEKKGENVI